MAVEKNICESIVFSSHSLAPGPINSRKAVPLLLISRKFLYPPLPRFYGCWRTNPRQWCFLVYFWFLPSYLVTSGLFSQFFILGRAE